MRLCFLKLKLYINYNFSLLHAVEGLTHTAIDVSKHYQSLSKLFIMQTNVANKYELLVQVRSWSNQVSKLGDLYIRLEVVVHSVKDLADGSYIDAKDLPFNVDVLKVSSKSEFSLKGKLRMENVLFITIEDCRKDKTHYVKDDEIIVHKEDFILVTKVVQAMSSEVTMLFENEVISKSIYTILTKSIERTIMLSLMS